MEEVKISEIINAVHGECKGFKKDACVTGVSIDSRILNAGDAFFAIKGDRYDGHDFVEKVAAKKASVAVVAKNTDIKTEIPIIKVEDTVKALQDFAKYYRLRFKVCVIGITGSNGKTTTKDFLASILSQKNNVLHNRGNLNNHIGLPLTIFNLDKKHTHCVLEMGANHIGEIALLSDIASPEGGIITNIGKAHIGYFGTMQNILNAKMELFEYISRSEKGFICVNNDDNFLPKALKQIKCRRITYGIVNKADVFAEDVNSSVEKTTFKMLYEGKKYDIEIPIGGIFNVYNAMAAASASLMLGIGIEEVRYGLANFEASPYRGEIIKLKNGAILVNDAYNANPTSMKASIDNFFKMFYNKHKILVLGDMYELGESAVEEHKNIGEYIEKSNLSDAVYTIGNLSKNISDKVKNGKAFKNKDTLAEYLKSSIRENDAVLFKASRKIGLEEVIKLITG